MRLSRTPRVWVALMVLGALAFAHASVSIAACAMERGTMVEVLAVETEAPCDCGTSVTESGPLYANRCLAHCTADLQLAGAAVAIAADAVQGAMLPVPQDSRSTRPLRSAGSSPAAVIPRRIQLHSFQL